MIKKNIFSAPAETDKQEIFEILFQTNNFKVERIYTLQPYIKPGEWYDQPQDEWVLLLKGEAVLEMKDEEYIQLVEGEYIFIPAHKIHRVRASSKDKPCIWLAIHGILE
jgi:cupin 2 domain-containing protein